MSSTPVTKVPTNVLKCLLHIRTYIYIMHMYVYEDTVLLLHLVLMYIAIDRMFLILVTSLVHPLAWHQELRVYQVRANLCQLHVQCVQLT